MCKLKVLSEDNGIVSGVTDGRGPRYGSRGLGVGGRGPPPVTRTLDSQQEVHFGSILLSGRSPWRRAGLALLALAALALFSFASSHRKLHVSDLGDILSPFHPVTMVTRGNRNTLTINNQSLSSGFSCFPDHVGLHWGALMYFSSFPSACC